jgi:SAM-dependent methyltransferase
VSSYDAFAPIYDEWATVMTEDVAFYVDLARESDGPLVELGVGTGRVAIPVAEATGRRVLGIDASAPMLAAARERAAAAGVELEVRHGDMRDLEVDEPAGLVYSPFRSLLHLPSWADRRRVFERVAAALRPGGRFAWNAFVFDPRRAAELWARDVRHGETSLLSRSEYVPADCRIDVTAWTRDDRSDERRVSLWWVARSEWEGLLDVARLQTEALYGWFDRRPFDEGSTEFVWVARKPA